MQKKKIAIISILKPVDDVRSYDKMAKTLAPNASLDIHIFGFSNSASKESLKNVHFQPSKTFKRLSISRLWRRIGVLISLFKLKPEVIIVNTHELLTVSMVCKILFGSILLYDIQENYYFNIKYQQHYPFLIRETLAILVRLKETLLSPFIEHFILAEQCYKTELPFIRNRHTIIENKAIFPPKSKSQKLQNSKFKILFSGTLTKSNGILIALDIMEALRHANDKFEFVVIGHCPSLEIEKILGQSKYNFIQLYISKNPIPHEQIEEQIASSHFGLVTYQINRSNQNCMPTKVYEYVIMGLPIIYQQGTHWGKLITNWQAGIAIDFNDLDTKTLIDELVHFELKPNLEKINESSWLPEGQRFKNLVEDFLF